MNAQSLRLLRTALTAGAMLTGLIGAILAFMASAQTRAERSSAQQWFERKWQAISRSSWSSLPEVVILWLLKGRSSLTALVFSAEDREDPVLYSAVIWGVPVTFGLAVG